MKTYLSKLTLRQRFLVLPATVAVVLVLLAAAGILPGYFLNNALAHLNRDQTGIVLPGSALMSRLSMGQSDLLVSLSAVGGDKAAIPGEKIDRQIQTATQAIDFIRKSFRGDQTRTRSAADRVADDLKAYIGALETAGNGDPHNLAEGLDTAFNAVLASYGTLMDRQAESDKLTAERPASLFGAGVVVAVVLVLLALPAFYMISRSIGDTIIAPIHKVADYFEAVAQGDLSKRIDTAADELIGELGRHYNSAMERLREIIIRFSKSCIVLTVTSKNLDDNSKELAAGIDDMLEQVNPVASATEEMAGTTSEIASNCTSAEESSEQANRAAADGEAIIAQTIDAIANINEFVQNSAGIIKNLKNRSSDISKAIYVIEEIAFQTKILALNATTEAARAGEAGRGFAVVSNEIKKLSAKTKEATQNIRKTVEAIDNETDGAVSSIEEGLSIAAKGVEEARRSGEAFKNIAQQIATLSAQISQIASASSAQSAATDEIAKNIQQVSRIMQESTGNVQHNAESAERTAALSNDLKKIVGQFKFARPEDAKAIVDRAYEYIKVHGKEKAMAEFNNVEGQFFQGELFIFAQDYRGVFLAYGGNTSLVGVKAIDVRDPNGKYLGRDMIQLARTKGSGWYEYAYQNPLTEEIADKLTYIKNVDGYYIACGIYK